MIKEMFEMCECGHFGGMSPNGMHEDRFQNGHGECRECTCRQFTWTGFVDSMGMPLSTDEIQEYAKQKREKYATQ